MHLKEQELTKSITEFRGEKAKFESSKDYWFNENEKKEQKLSQDRAKFDRIVERHSKEYANMRFITYILPYLAFSLVPPVLLALLSENTQNDLKNAVISIIETIIKAGKWFGSLFNYAIFVYILILLILLVVVGWLMVEIAYPFIKAAVNKYHQYSYVQVILINIVIYLRAFSIIPINPIGLFIILEIVGNFIFSRKADITI